VPVADVSVTVTLYALRRLSNFCPSRLRFTVIVHRHAGEGGRDERTDGRTGAGLPACHVRRAGLAVREEARPTPMGRLVRAEPGGIFLTATCVARRIAYKKMG
jgi:hypothetical protein